MKTNHSLILLRANIRKKKGERVFILTQTRTYQKLSFEQGLLVMNRCRLPLWAGEGLNHASLINRRDVACYEKIGDEITIAVLQKNERYRNSNSDSKISLYPKEPESITLSFLSGTKLNTFIESLIKRIDNGKRLEDEFVENAIRKARLELVPKGWKVVTEGNVRSGDRYYQENDRRCPGSPSIVSWTSCDVCFSAHKPGSPVKRYGWDDTIIIRKKQ